MITVDASEIEGFIASVPFKRTLKPLISPSIQSGVKGLGLGMTIFPPGSRSNSHSHDVTQEVWYVVSGEGEIVVGDETARLKPDMVVVAPPGLPHHLTNTGDEDLKVLWIFVPPGPETEFIKK